MAKNAAASSARLPSWRSAEKRSCIFGTVAILTVGQKNAPAFSARLPSWQACFFGGEF
jgi:hypothetical protein